MERIRDEGEETNSSPAERMKSNAVIGFIGADPIARLFILSLSISHPNKTKKGIAKAIHPNTIEQFLMKLILASIQISSSVFNNG